MSRLVGLLLVATLLAAPGVARAQPLLPAAPSFGTALILRIFGETDVAGRLALRNQNDESPLHASAFRVSLVMLQPEPVEQIRIAAAAQAIALGKTSARQTMPRDVSATALPRVTASIANPLRVTAEYQPVTVPPSASATSAFSFPIRQSDAGLGLVTQGTEFGEFGALAPGTAQVPLSMRVGGVHLEARFGAASQIGAAGAESEEILPAFIAPYTSVDRNALGAALAVPVAPRLLLGFGYDTEHLLAGYQLPGYDDLDARNDMYSGRLTFLIPRFSSALSLSAEQYRYQDNLLQSDAYTQLRESLNLTVKF